MLEVEEERRMDFIRLEAWHALSSSFEGDETVTATQITNPATSFKCTVEAETLDLDSNIFFGPLTTEIVYNSPVSLAHVSQLTTALTLLNSLEVLNLDHSMLGPLAFSYIYRLVGKLKHLKVLSLNNCLLQEEGGILLAQTLERLPALKVLRLQCNALKESVVAVARRVGPALEELDLVGNAVDEESRTALLQTLPASVKWVGLEDRGEELKL